MRLLTFGIQETGHLRTSGNVARAMLRRMAEDTSPRTYRFSITITVEADDAAFDDPGWVADAAAGALSNIYGYKCVYDEIELVALL